MKSSQYVKAQRNPSYYSITAGTRHNTLKSAKASEIRALRTQGGGSGGIDKVTKAGGRFFYRTVTTKGTPRTNPGRKIKGGRAISLKNFTGRVIRKSNGQVHIGRGKWA